jgi:hypothetical protein
MILYQVDSDRLRAEAERILSHPKYRVNTTISERSQIWLSELWLGFLDFLRTISNFVGGPLVLSLLMLGLVVVASVLVARNLGKRRVRDVEERIRREHALARGEDPRDLEERAEAAAEDGNHAESVRLLFRGGLLRLDEQGKIPFRPGLTRSEIEVLLRSSHFELLATRFDEIVYGGKLAGPVDYEQARAGWAALLAEPVGAGRK